MCVVIVVFNVEIYIRIKQATLIGEIVLGYHIIGSNF
jgi:hypothetical protein